MVGAVVVEGPGVIGVDGSAVEDLDATDASDDDRVLLVLLLLSVVPVAGLRLVVVETGALLLELPPALSLWGTADSMTLAYHLFSLLCL